MHPTKKKRGEIPLQTIELIASLGTIIIGHILKLIDVLVNNTRYTWLSLAGSGLVIVVLGYLMVKLIVKARRVKHSIDLPHSRHFEEAPIEASHKTTLRRD